MELPIENGVFIVSIEDESWAKLCRLLSDRRTDGMVFDPKEALESLTKSADGPVFDPVKNVVLIPVEWLFRVTPDEVED